ncbi:hypothetical protein NEMIN01_2138 [Nematocida minor]|uniref:uncharacterized protein n=1 Tax=Nematocida minor TaxID=1912983 RepID=UPI002220D573|nr:uncharacterized protein NEMIN01_2138 [Nematocida minor]KAI5192671.1 hypothetical protein NEMIN01_2138 [Nematocida minor]
MEKKVEKELQDAQEDIKDAINAEKKRSASISSLEQQSVELDASLTGLQEETHSARKRLWKKCLKWIIVATIIFLILGGLLFSYVYDKLKSSLNMLN